MLHLYDYAASGNCYKIRLALAQLGTPYERVPVDIFGGDTLTDGFAAINPMRVTPVLGLESGRFLPESGAILLHLAEGTPLLPADREDRADVYRWLMFERTFTGAVGGARFHRMTGRDAETPGEQERLIASGIRVLHVLDSHLDGRDWLAGDAYSIADIAVFAYAHVADEAGIDMSAYAAIAAWIERVRGTPGFIADLEPYPDNAMAGRGRSLYDTVAR